MRNLDDFNRRILAFLQRHSGRRSYPAAECQHDGTKTRAAGTPLPSGADNTAWRTARGCPRPDPPNRGLSARAHGLPSAPIRTICARASRRCIQPNRPAASCRPRARQSQAHRQFGLGGRPDDPRPGNRMPATAPTWHPARGRRRSGTGEVDAGGDVDRAAQGPGHRAMIGVHAHHPVDR